MTDKKQPQLCLKDRLLTSLRENETVIYVLPAYERVPEWRAPEPLLPPPSERGWEDYRNGTRTTAALLAPAQDAMTVREIVRELGWRGKSINRTIKGKEYIIFKGHPGQRKLLRDVAYPNTHPTVVRMALGPKGLLNSARGGAVLSAVLFTGIDVLEYLLVDSVGLHSMLGQLSVDLASIGISAITSALAGLLVGSTVVVGGFAVSPLVVAIAVGLATGWVLQKIDERFGATKALIDYYEQMGIELTSTWDQIAALPATLANEVTKWEKHITSTILRRRGFGY